MELAVKDIVNNRDQPLKYRFENLYNAVRQHEKKTYTDEQLKQLPDFDAPSGEWEIRKQSSGRLISYLKEKKRHLNILEVGCGNGWLSAKLADLPNTRVTGLDVNCTEIAQAKRVFKKANLCFIEDSFNETTFDKERFDIILFAASLQYFPSVTTALQQAVSALNNGGEIHIIDTPFYKHTESAEAARRCREYYTDMGIPEMADHYFHHAISEFLGLNYSILSSPYSLVNRALKRNPFYWIAIKN